MPKLRMKENDLMTEYHGKFDCLVGEHSPELPIEIAVKVAQRLPKIFEPVDFSIEEFNKNQTAENKVKEENLVTIRFIFNPLFAEYHSADGIDFDKAGDTQRFPYNKAKKLLEKFPEAFEVVTDITSFQNEEAEVQPDAEDNKNSVAIVQETAEEAAEEDPTAEGQPVACDRTRQCAGTALEQQIVEILKEAPHSFDELEKKVDIPFNQLRGSVISLSKNKQIVKDDDEKWVIVK